jgi:predicted nucleic acid-binding protein
LSSKNIEFFTVDYVTKEISKYKSVITEKSTMSPEADDTLFSLVMENINIIPEEDVKSKMKEAFHIMKDIDTKDAPFVAAALTMPNDGIWSHDKHFEKQNKVKIWLAKDLLKYI